MKWIDIDQNTDEWLDLRSGKITSSNMGKIMANDGKAFGEPAKKMAVSIATERATGNRIESEGFTNAHMERGHIQEPLARELYETTNFVDVTNGGFYDCGIQGCSPDGLVNDDGVIEIKSVIPNVQYSNMKRNNVDPAYKWQVFTNLMLSEREWIDFISYCEWFPERTRLFTYRVWAKDCQQEFEKITNRVNEYNQLIETIIGEIK